MRILFVSVLRDPGASGLQRLNSLSSLGHEVHELALDGFDRRGLQEMRVRERVLRPWPFRGTDERTLGRAFEEAVRRHRPELVWVEKALLLRPEFLNAARALLPSALFVCFQDDDPFGFRRRERATWRNFLRAIPCYDVHFVKRKENLQEFADAGAQRCLTFMHGVYAPLFHPPLEPHKRFRDVIFAGTPHDHRVGILDTLLARHKLPVDILGPGWQRSSTWTTHRAHYHPAVFDQAYADALRSTKIALGFVSSSNRDEYSMRTFEIPACGAMLLAERTPAHQQLFVEGSDAEFFSSAEECADKCRFYLANEEARARMAAAGQKKMLRRENSLASRLHDALDTLGASRT